MPPTTPWPPSSVAVREEITGGIVALTYDQLNTQDITSLVADDRAGATAVFIGTTRNSFQGKIVTRLDYQAYSKMAVKEICSIIQRAHAQHISPSAHQTENTTTTSLIRCAVYHRLGTVPVGKPSIVIAVSSPHREAAFEACEFILEEVKRTAQIWKREFYEGEREQDAEWKTNA